MAMLNNYVMFVYKGYMILSQFGNFHKQTGTERHVEENIETISKARKLRTGGNWGKFTSAQKAMHVVSSRFVSSPTLHYQKECI